MNIALIIVLAIIIAAFLYFIIGYNAFGNIHRKSKDVRDYQGAELYKDYCDEINEFAKRLDDIPCKKLEVISKDGFKLSGRLYEGNPGSPYVVFFHGFKSSFMFGGYTWYKLHKENGYNLVFIDMRAHGESEGTLVTLGIMEYEDVFLWSEKIKKMAGDAPVFLAGVSMGASSILMASSKFYSSGTNGLICDSPYDSVSEEIKAMLKKSHIPMFPIYKIIKSYARIVIGVAIEEHDISKLVKKSRVPVIIFHGLADAWVDYHMSQRIFDNYLGEDKFLYLVEGADHAQTSLKNNEFFCEKVNEFIERYS